MSEQWEISFVTSRGAIRVFLFAFVVIGRFCDLRPIARSRIQALRKFAWWAIIHAMSDRQP